MGVSDRLRSLEQKLRPGRCGCLPDTVELWPGQTGADFPPPPVPCGPRCPLRHVRRIIMMIPEGYERPGDRLEELAGEP